MTLHSLAVPDDPAELPPWLEGRLVALDFAEFVAELRAHFPGGAVPQPVRQLLDRWLPVALNEGLEPLPPEVLNQLLKHPAALAELQERIVEDGGAYWDDVMDRTGDLSGAFSNGRQSIERILAVENRPSSEPKGVPSSLAHRPSGRGYKIWAGVSTGIALGLAVAVGILATREPDEPPVMKSQIAWGWGKPGGLPIDLNSGKEYLDKLASNAEEWQLYRPGDAASLGLRIAEFRIGCTRLMHSSYGPLAPADKDWLLARCRAWAKALDDHQQALDAGAESQAVRSAVDETVQTIATTLREKAKQLG